MIDTIRELFIFRGLLYALVYRDIKSRTKQAFMGYFWVVIQPILATGVFTIIFQVILRVNPSTGDVPYPLFVLTGMILWQHFANSLAASTESLVTHQDLITQVYLPRAALVAYPLLAKLVDFGISGVVLLLAMALYRVPPQLGGLIILVLLPAQMILAFGLGLLLAPLNVAFRDVARIVPIVLSFALYMVPVVYPLSQVPAQAVGLYLLNPMAVVVDTFRSSLLLGQAPNLLYVGTALAISLGILVIAERLFRRFEVLLADVV